MISCGARLVTMDETWLYHYDPETKQSNNQLSGGIAAHPAPIQKLPSAKIRWKSSRLDFLGSNGILLIDYLSKGQTINTEYYLSLLVQLKDILKEKRLGAGMSPRWSCSCTTMPRLSGHLQPRRNWLAWASSVLIAHPILRIWPRRTTTCSLD